MFSSIGTIYQCCVLVTGEFCKNKHQRNSKSSPAAVLLLILYTHIIPPKIMWTLAKQAKLQSFRKKPSYILLYIVVCKICSVCSVSSCYNFIAKFYPMLDVLLMSNTALLALRIHTILPISINMTSSSIQQAKLHAPPPFLSGICCCCWGGHSSKVLEDSRYGIDGCFHVR